MKRINWNTGKSVSLKATRGICFEGVVFFIEKGAVLDDCQHPNQKEYPGQRILVINVDNFAYLVPYVEDEGGVFLKTIILSRKATKQYLGEKK